MNPFFFYKPYEVRFELYAETHVLLTFSQHSEIYQITFIVDSPIPNVTEINKVFLQMKLWTDRQTDGQNIIYAVCSRNIKLLCAKVPQGKTPYLQTTYSPSI
jgi:hypothetical protein